ncbi:uncharacterized protein AMSG_11541 [Thecamonas trahens ATCC 50062]|uniref:DUF7630 domain-containing protein n=1 Tax=Thecamonas trahens ATCC 50062 TaxID=461836 RepID=A0A0L0D2E0_THETB|nr:hypothetical protein AMSG_11541 [Thecamonas trahens ATCC 50062]KNC46462.1 hypothetical protein AMSG_11541 [Thecamonas trahens ATCC 50062]|eukprot:XP_013752612.1 hypothetical protein AMSG_11541 [Thecamonas trahens ATCC 50062]
MISTFTTLDQSVSLNAITLDGPMPTTPKLRVLDTVPDSFGFNALVAAIAPNIVAFAPLNTIRLVSLALPPAFPPTVLPLPSERFANDSQLVALTSADPGVDNFNFELFAMRFDPTTMTPSALTELSPLDDAGEATSAALVVSPSTDPGAFGSIIVARVVVESATSASSGASLSAFDSLPPITSYSHASRAAAIAGLVNSDTEPDIVIIDTHHQVITLINNIQSGVQASQFQPILGPILSEVLDFGTGAIHISLADADGDGSQDLMLTCLSSPTSTGIWYLPNAGGGQWNPLVSLATLPFTIINVVPVSIRSALAIEYIVALDETNNVNSLVFVYQIQAGSPVFAHCFLPPALNTTSELIAPLRPRHSPLPSDSGIVIAPHLASSSYPLFWVTLDQLGHECKWSSTTLTVLPGRPSALVAGPIGPGATGDDVVSIINADNHPMRATSTVFSLAIIRTSGPGNDVVLVCGAHLVVWQAVEPGMLAPAPQRIAISAASDNGETLISLVDLDGNGFLDIVRLASNGLLLSLQLPNPWLDNPFAERIVPLPPANFACTQPGSLACLATALSHVSNCRSDTVAVDSMLETCRMQDAIKITRSASIVGSSVANAGISCHGKGILFSIAGGEKVVLDSLTLTHAHSSNRSIFGAPPLRVVGSGSRLVLTNIVLSGFANPAVDADYGLDILAPGYGGALFIADGAAVDVINSDISNCVAGSSGGFAYITSKQVAPSSLRIIRSRLYNNAAVAGGVVAVGRHALVVINNCAIDINIVTSWGAVLATVGKGMGVSVIANDTTFSGNNAGGCGGVISIGYKTSMLVGSSTFDRNSATAGGVLAVLQDFNPQVISSGAVAHPALLSLPYVRYVAAHVVLDNVTVTDNGAAYGGLFFLVGCSIEVTGRVRGWGNSVLGEAGSVAYASQALGEHKTDLGVLVRGTNKSRADLRSACLPVRWGGDVATPIATIEWLVGADQLNGTAVPSGFALPHNFAVVVRDTNGALVIDSDVVIELQVYDGKGGSFAIFGGTPQIILRQNVTELTSMGIAITSMDQIGSWVTVRALASYAAVEGFSNVATQAISLLIDGCPGNRPPVPHGDSALVCVCPVNAISMQLIDAETGVQRTGCGCTAQFWTPSLPVARCDRCPIGGDCVGGEAKPSAADGYFPTSDPSYFLKCPIDGACAGSGTCAAGYSGRLCAKCASGWYATGLVAGKCTQCKLGAAGTAAVLATIGVLCIILLVGYVVTPQSISNDRASRAPGSLQEAPMSLWDRIRSHTGRIKTLAMSSIIELVVVVLLGVFGLAKAWEVVVIGLCLVTLSLYAVVDRPAQTTRISAVLKTIVVFVQTVGAVLSSGNGLLSSSSSLHTIYGVLQRASLTLTGLGCLDLGQLGLLWLFVALTAGPVLLCLALRYAPCQSQGMRRRAEGAAGTLGYLFVFPLLHHLLEHLSCVPDPTPGAHRSYLDAAPWIACGSDEHIALVVSALSVLLGIASAVAVTSTVAWRAHQASEREICDDRLVPLLDSDADVAIAVAVATIPRGSVFTSGVLAATVAVSLAAHLHFRPYIDEVAHRMEITGLVAALIVIQIVGMMEQAEAETSIAVLAAEFVIVTIGVVATGLVVAAGAV